MEMSKIAIAKPASAIDVGAADASKVDAAFVIKERYLLTFQNLVICRSHACCFPRVQLYC
jgi:hypothetical protein